MKKILSVLLFVVLIIIPDVGFAQAKSSIESCSKAKIRGLERNRSLSKFASLGDTTIDVKYYKLDLNISHTNKNISGAVTITAASAINNLQKIFFDLNNKMTIDSAKIGNKKLNPTHSNNKISLTLDKAYVKSEKFSVIIYYHGNPASSGLGSFTFSTNQGGKPAIWSLSEPYGAKDWWPCKDSPDDKADSTDVWLTCAKELIPVSNGKLMEKKDNANGTHTYKWHSSYPIAQYLISVATSNYKEIVEYFKFSETDSMKIVHYIYPEEDNSTIRKQLSLTTNMLKVFSDLFGSYPFIKEKYGHASCNFGGGMEHQTISSMGGYGESLMAHELAHQWFGDKITCKDWSNIWLNEGFATYAEALYNEVAYGEDEYLNTIKWNMEDAKLGDGSIYVSNISSPDRIFDGSLTYSKAGTVLHMLRGVVGDEKFFNILKTYVAAPNLVYGTAVTEDFQKIAENVYGKSLDYFFKEWIYGVNYPKYEYSWKNESISEGYKVTLNVSQKANSSPHIFTMPIQIKILTGSGDTTLTVFNDQAHQQFEFTLKDQPSNMQFDPDNWILKEVNETITSISDNHVVPNNFRLEQNYPNPFNPSTIISYTLPEKSKVTLIVYDMLGRKVTDLVNGREESAGTHYLTWNAKNSIGQDVAGGIYIYQLVTSKKTLSKKMILLR